MPDNFSDRCIFPSEDPRDLSPDPECTHCEEEFPRDQLNERGFCLECESRWDEKSPNYDPGDMEPNGEAWDGGFASNH